MTMEQRSPFAERGALVSVWGLMGLSVLKGSVGWLTGSKALMADACQSAADCAGSVASYLGLRKTRANPNAASSRHGSPAAVSIVLSAVLLVSALEIGISSVRAVAEGVDEAPGWGAVVVIAVGIGLREGLIQYKRSRENRFGVRGDRTGENRSDIFASLTALVGTSGAAAGELLDMPFLYVLDPAAGLVIAVFVLRMGYRLAAGVLQTPDRRILDQADNQMLLEAVQRIDGVVMVDELQAREHGHYVILDVVIRVNPRISVIEGHDIALRIRRQLTKRFLHVSDVSVKVQPYDPGYPYKSNHHDEELSTLLQ
jgi:cation diffusion facilitator family transporter